MTFAKKRTAGAALAGCAILAGAIFTPVAAYAAVVPPTTDDTTDVAPAATPTIAPIESPVLQSTTIEGVAWSGTGFAAEAAVTVEIREAGSEEWQPVGNGDGVADSDGNVSGAVVLERNGATVVIPAGSYELRVTQGEGETVLTASTTFEVVESLETEEPAPSEPEAPVAEAAIVTEQTVYTASESLNGVDWAGAGFNPDEAFTVEVLEPGAEDWAELLAGDDEERIADADGYVSGAINYSTYYEDTPNDRTPAEFPVGEYGVRVVQGEGDDQIVAATTFEVVADEVTEAPVPTETDDATQSPVPTQIANDEVDDAGEDQLAQTGADSMLPIFLAGGLVLVAAGAGMFLVRRRAEA